MVCGKNVFVVQSLEMAEISLVGRVKGHYPNLEQLEKWAFSNWIKRLNHNPKILVRAMGWFVFKFRNNEDG